MKVLMINKFLYPNGGSETYIFKLGDYLKTHGHEVQYFGMEHEGRCVGNAVNAYTSDMDFHNGSKLSKLTYPIKTIYSSEARKKLRLVLDDFQPDVCHINNFNYQLTPAGLMFEEPLRNLGCAVIPAGPTDASTQLDIMQKLRVSGYVGTPSFLMHLAQKAEEKGLNLRKDLFLEVAFVTGERLSEKMRSQMEKKYDLIMRQGYGTADVGCIGYECFHKTGLHIANRCYVEICHPDTGIPLKDGEVGEIVVTAFNKTYPLIRLATGDLSYIDRSPCACGRTSPRLGNIVGRVDTTARIMGMFVYPHQVEQVMSRFEEVKRWQIEVTNPGGIDEMTLFIETSGFKREEELLHQFREKIKLRPELKILAPGSLPPQIRPIEDKRHWD